MEKIISPFIASQFPEIYREEGPTLVAFIQAYYEWLDQVGNVGNLTRSIQDYTDIDTTLDQFISYFTNTYLNGIPVNVVSDKRLLVKHIKEFYQAKGSFRATQLLFRIVFNEDIDIVYPSDFILKGSDGTWVVPRYIEVTDSPYLSKLIGKQIYGSTTNATATVEQYIVKTFNNKIVNVLILSNLKGNFSYGELILNDSIGMSVSASPIVFGSLSSISITQGGANYNVGDILNVVGSGVGGRARVISTREENGTVSFQLINGGYGYSLGATVEVSGGYGTGASFSVGGLIDTQVFSINTDYINLYYNTQLEIPSYGYILYLTGISGTFQIGESVTMSANVLPLDITYLSGNSAVTGDIFSNTSLSISNVSVVESQGSYLLVTANTAMLNKINPLPSGGIILTSTSNSVIEINSTIIPYTLSGNGTVFAVNSSSISLNNINGRFSNTFSVKGLTSNAIGTVLNSYRATNWMFPSVNIPDVENLDTSILNTLTYDTKIIGTISYLNNINPGIGYSSNPVVTISEPEIAALQIPDNIGGYWGQDAVVTASANSSYGIVTGIQIIDSGYGYVPNENVVLDSNNVFSVNGISSVYNTGYSSGYFKDRKGFLSDQNYLQDSNYYQAYSYEIIASRMFSTYKKLVEDFVHPCGMKLFGKYALKDYNLSSSSITHDDRVINNVGYSSLLDFSNRYNSQYLPLFNFGF